MTEPVETLAVALLAEVVREGVGADEANERVELADAVLKWSSCAKSGVSALSEPRKLDRLTRETPAELGPQREGSLGGVAPAILDVVRLVEDDTMPSWGFKTVSDAAMEDRWRRTDHLIL